MIYMSIPTGTAARTKNFRLLTLAGQSRGNAAGIGEAGWQAIQETLALKRPL